MDGNLVQDLAAPLQCVSGGPPHFLAQPAQCIELLVIKFGPPVHPGFADLCKPLGTMPSGVNLFAGTRNGPQSESSSARIITKARLLMPGGGGSKLPGSLIRLVLTA